MSSTGAAVAQAAKLAIPKLAKNLFMIVPVFPSDVIVPTRPGSVKAFATNSVMSAIIRSASLLYRMRNEHDGQAPVRIRSASDADAGDGAIAKLTNIGRRMPY